MFIVHAIASSKGWIYQPRHRERDFGYHFTGKNTETDPEMSRYFCRIKADNPVDAANRLRPIKEAIKDLPPLKPKLNPMGVKQLASKLGVINE